MIRMVVLLERAKVANLVKVVTGERDEDDRHIMLTTVETIQQWEHHMLLSTLSSR